MISIERKDTAVGSRRVSWKRKKHEEEGEIIPNAWGLKSKESVSKSNLTDPYTKRKEGDVWKKEKTPSPLGKEKVSSPKGEKGSLLSRKSEEDLYCLIGREKEGVISRREKRNDVRQSRREDLLLGGGE